MAGKRILVVDDDETFRIIARVGLAKHGYEVLEASNGREAKARLFASLPDLIILDIMMPDQDGVVLCREIRNTEATKHIPVIVISALGDPKTTMDALSFGATDYIVKPVDVSVIKEKIDRIFHG